MYGIHGIWEGCETVQSYAKVSWTTIRYTEMQHKQQICEWIKMYEIYEIWKGCETVQSYAKVSWTTIRDTEMQHKQYARECVEIW